MNMRRSLVGTDHGPQDRMSTRVPRVCAPSRNDDRVPDEGPSIGTISGPARSVTFTQYLPGPRRAEPMCQAGPHPYAD